MGTFTLSNHCSKWLFILTKQQGMLFRPLGLWVTKLDKILWSKFFKMNLKSRAVNILVWINKLFIPFSKFLSNLHLKHNHCVWLACPAANKYSVSGTQATRRIIVNTINFIFSAPIKISFSVLHLWLYQL